MYEKMDQILFCFTHKSTFRFHVKLVKWLLSTSRKGFKKLKYVGKIRTTLFLIPGTYCCVNVGEKFLIFFKFIVISCAFQNRLDRIIPLYIKLCPVKKFILQIFHNIRPQFIFIKLNHLIIKMRISSFFKIELLRQQLNLQRFLKAYFSIKYHTFIYLKFLLIFLY